MRLYFGHNPQSPNLLRNLTARARETTLQNHRRREAINASRAAEFHHGGCTNMVVADNKPSKTIPNAQQIATKPAHPSPDPLVWPQIFRFRRTSGGCDPTGPRLHLAVYCPSLLSVRTVARHHPERASMTRTALRAACGGCDSPLLRCSTLIPLRCFELPVAKTGAGYHPVTALVARLVASFSHRVTSVGTLSFLASSGMRKAPALASFAARHHALISGGRIQKRPLTHPGEVFPLRHRLSVK